MVASLFVMKYGFLKGHVRFGWSMVGSLDGAWLVTRHQDGKRFLSF